MQANIDQFRSRGAEVVALAVAPWESVNGASEAVSARYPLLADTDHQAADAWGVYDLLGDGYAAPSVFVIDEYGQVVWSHIGERDNDRPAVTEILNHLP